MTCNKREREREREERDGKIVEGKIKVMSP
jgi:hypothetical protein